MVEASPLGPDVPVAELALALFAGGSLVAFAGPYGALAALAVLAAWYALDEAYAFAVGQVGVVAFLADAPPVAVGVAEAGLFGLLLVPLTAGVSAGRTVAVAVGWTAVGGLAAWASAEGVVGLPVAAGALLAATALAAFGLHRYQRVELGGVAGE